MSETSFVEDLRDSALPFVRDTADLGRTRRLRRDLPGFDEAAFAQVRELGWLSILVPEADGGSGLGFAEMAAVLEALEAGLLAEPLLGLLPGLRALVHAEAGELRSGLLAGVIEGGVLPALALGRDAALPQVTVEEGGEAQLSGRCDFVPAGHAASGFVVPVGAGGTVELYWVERDAAGATLEAAWRADDTPLGRLALDRAPARRLSGDFGARLEAVLDEARVLASASLVGLMRHVFEGALEYMRTRVQYDRPIGAFQALQHKAVDLHIQLELSISVLGVALKAFDAGDGADARERRLAAVRAKARCSEAGLRLTREAIQIHGAIGFTDEFDLGLYVKRALVLSSWLGGAAEQRRRFLQLTTEP